MRSCLSRAGFGALAETIFPGVSQTDSKLSEWGKVRDGEDTIANTRAACATQELGHSQTVTTSLD